MKYLSLLSLLALCLFATSASAQEGDGSTCLPGCRSGFVCVQSQCVSACNPVCDAGQICTAELTCVDVAPRYAKPVDVQPVKKQPRSRINGFQIHLGANLGFAGKTTWETYNSSDGYGEEQYKIAPNLGVDLHLLAAFAKYVALGVDLRLGSSKPETRFDDTKVWIFDTGPVVRGRYPIVFGGSTLEPFLEIGGGVATALTNPLGIDPYLGIDGGTSFYFNRVVGVHVRVGWRKYLGEGREEQMQAGLGLSLRL